MVLLYVGTVRLTTWSLGDSLFILGTDQGSGSCGIVGAEVNYDEAPPLMLEPPPYLSVQTHLNTGPPLLLPPSTSFHPLTHQQPPLPLHQIIVRIPNHVHRLIKHAAQAAVLVGKVVDERLKLVRGGTKVGVRSARVADVSALGPLREVGGGRHLCVDGEGREKNGGGG